MKKNWAFCLMLCGLTFSSIFLEAWAAQDVSIIESKTQSEIEQMLIRVLPRDQFLVQVSTETDTVQERKLVEGEQIISTQAQDPQVSVPPLPGFSVKPSPVRSNQPSQTRQVYTTVEKIVLKSLLVQVTIDDSVSDETVNRVRTMASNYIKANFGMKGSLSLNRVKMLASGGTSPLRWISENLGTFFLGLIFIVFLLGAWFFLRNRFYRTRGSFARMEPNSYGRDNFGGPAVVSANEVTGQLPHLSPQDRPALTGPISPMLGSGGGPLALPSGAQVGAGKYPPLPATAAFVDRRSDLLEFFLKNADVFRVYFGKLPPAARLELYAGLRGPAFDNFLEALEIQIPEGGDTMAPPSEDQMIFYNKNFDEFLRANEWQDRQFFGFFQRLKNDQIITLIQSENALVCAVILKFLKPAQAAAVLDGVSSEKRLEILSQFGRVNEISSSELNSIEASVRNQISSLPQFIWGASKKDAEYWSGILSQTVNQEEILSDLEQSRPDLYPQLAKFRFQLDDVPALPEPLIIKILDDVDNDEMTKALLTCSTDSRAFLLSKMNQNRRGLIESQLVSYSGIPENQLLKSRQKVTQRFREVMA